MLRWMLASGRRLISKGIQVDKDEESSGTSSDGAQLSDESEQDEPMLESWVDWIRRTTEVAEEQLRKLVLDDWVSAQRRRKFRFTGHVLRREDDRWSKQVLVWTPQEGYRHRGHPRKRWRDVFDKFFQGAWGVTS
eukprot:4990872-Karenia_brevis.AAC.1